MLKSLKLEQLGPCDQVDLTFGDRLTVITGDNSLGKSFLLDTAWWALTGVWPAELNKQLASGLKARPKKTSSRITYQISGVVGSEKAHKSAFDIKTQSWKRPTGRPTNPGLVVYAMADGAFSVWDPSRNYWNRPGEVTSKLPAYVFSPKNVWDGIFLRQEGKSICEGLIRDLASWLTKPDKSVPLKNILHLLSILAPDDSKHISFGQLVENYDINESRTIPTIKYLNDEEVPITFASSAIKRILGMVYLIHWAWQENRRFAKAYLEKPAKQLTLIVDEPEVHLHPKWQKKILPSLLELFRVLSRGGSMQVICCTHSPLVLGSLEGVFDTKKDKWFDLDAVRAENSNSHTVQLTERAFVNQGDYQQWLKSEAFNFDSFRTDHAQKVYERAQEYIQQGLQDEELLENLNEEVTNAFGEESVFRTKWNLFYLNQMRNNDKG